MRLYDQDYHKFLIEDARTINSHCGTHYRAECVFKALDCQVSDHGQTERFLADYQDALYHDPKAGTFKVFAQAPTGQHWHSVQDRFVIAAIRRELGNLLRDVRVIDAAYQAGILSGDDRERGKFLKEASAYISGNLDNKVANILDRLRTKVRATTAPVGRITDASQTLYDLSRQAA